MLRIFFRFEDPFCASDHFCLIKLSWNNPTDPCSKIPGNQKKNWGFGVCSPGVCWKTRLKYIHPLETNGWNPKKAPLERETHLPKRISTSRSPNSKMPTEFSNNLSSPLRIIALRATLTVCHGTSLIFPVNTIKMFDGFSSQLY